MPKVYNRAGMSTATTGTGTITLGSALTGYQSFADAGASNGETIAYLIEEGNSWELGTGTYTASGTTLTRTVTESSNSDSALNLAGTAQVFIVPRAVELQELIDFKETFTLPTSDGTADQVLKTDGSGVLSFTTAGSGGLVPISTTTASSDAAIDISLTGGYARYRVYFRGVSPASDNTELRGRLSDDGGSTFESGASDYDQAVARVAGASDEDANSRDYFIIEQTCGNSTDEEVNGWVEITLPSGGGGSRNATLSLVHARDNFANFHVTAGGCILTSTTTDATDVRFYFSSGNISSGTFDLYGINGVT